MIKKYSTYAIISSLVLTACIVPNLKLADNKYSDLSIDTNISAVINSTNFFASSLSQQILSKQISKNKNSIFSPYGIFGAISMTYAGARGQTEKEFSQVINNRLLQKHFHPAFEKLNNSMVTPSHEIQIFDGGQKDPGYELKILNRILVQKSSPILPDFAETIKTNYLADFDQVDFEKNKEQACERINNLVAEKTNNKIKDIISPASLDGRTKLVLLNMIYFSGKWEIPFDIENTDVAPFFVDNTNTIDTNMMQKTASYKYLEDKENGLQILEIPYKNETLSMVVLLPDRLDGLMELENKLNNQKELLKKYFTTLKSEEKQEVMVKMPKFKFEGEYSLNNVLMDIGIKKAFTNAANFSGINGGYDLYISQAIHKAFIEVNESGTKAAAATSVTMKTKSINFKIPTSTIFNADHPFKFIIKDNRTETILFMGSVVKP